MNWNQGDAGDAREGALDRGRWASQQDGETAGLAELAVLAELGKLQVAGTRITIRLDVGLVDHFQKEADASGGAMGARR